MDLVDIRDVLGIGLAARRCHAGRRLRFAGLGLCGRILATDWVVARGVFGKEVTVSTRPRSYIARACGGGGQRQCGGSNREVELAYLAVENDDVFCGGVGNWACSVLPCGTLWRGSASRCLAAATPSLCSLLVRICFTWCARMLGVGVQDGLSVGILAGFVSVSCSCVPSLSLKISGRRRRVYLCCSLLS